MGLRLFGEDYSCDQALVVERGEREIDATLLVFQQRVYILQVNHADRGWHESGVTSIYILYKRRPDALAMIRRVTLVIRRRIRFPPFLLPDSCSHQRGTHRVVTFMTGILVRNLL